MRVVIVLDESLTVGWVDSQIDGNVWDSLVASSDTICLVLNLLADFFKVHKLFAFAVQEFRHLDRAIDELKNQRTSSNNARASR